MMVIKNYNLYKPIGKGAFGQVFLTKKINNPELFATKMIDFNKLKDSKLKRYLSNEILIMQELKGHPNIIRLCDHISLHKCFFLIMEYCNGGSLLNLLKQYISKYKRPFPVTIIQYFMRQIVKALKYIHKKHIIHRDIKLANILIKFDSSTKKYDPENIDFNTIDDYDLLTTTIKIIDFGLSTRLGRDGIAKSALGTPFNMAPAILQKYKKAGGYKRLHGYNEKADIWSLGTICYEMFTGEPLFNANSMDELIKKVEQGNYQIPIDFDLSNEFLSFLNSMLQYNANERASAEELANHPFLVKDVKDFTKANLEKIPDKINLNYLIINTIKNGPIKDLFGKKEDNNREVLKRYIECLFVDYNSAQIYFHENKLKIQEEDAKRKCLAIKKLQNRFNSKIEVKISDLPKPITPEYIYGCSTFERNNKFKDILSKYRADKNDLEVKIKAFERNPLPKYDRAQIEKDKINFEGLKKIIEEFENKSKNTWIPAPKYSVQLKRYNTEKISYENCDFQIQIQITKVDDIKENLNTLIYFVVNESRVLKHELKLSYENNFSEQWNWTLNENEWINIDNNIDNFILGIDNSKNSTKENLPNAIMNVDVSKIKTGKAITFKQPVPNSNAKIHIMVIPILPQGQKKVFVEEKEFIILNYIFPAFETKSTATTNVPYISMIYK